MSKIDKIVEKNLVEALAMSSRDESSLWEMVESYGIQSIFHSLSNLSFIKGQDIRDNFPDEIISAIEWEKMGGLLNDLLKKARNLIVY